MPFWHRKQPAKEDQGNQPSGSQEQARPTVAHADLAKVDPGEAERLRAEDLRQLARGGIPATARARLNVLKGAVAGGGTFNSDLSSSEAALLHHGGYTPLGLVGGSAMYHIGAHGGFAARDGELTVVSRAYNHATELAVERMRKEARELRAHGVVGVRFSLTRHDWAEDCVEVRVLGTAVLTSGSRVPSPWLSDLSGQEWWAMHQAGVQPTGLVYAHCVWFAATTAADKQIERNMENKEFKHLSTGLTKARTIANARIQEMARKQGAHGVAGVHLTRRVEEFEFESESSAIKDHHLLTLSIIGTAVRDLPSASVLAVPTRLVVSLRD